jgi:hypothetical protein
MNLGMAFEMFDGMMHWRAAGTPFLVISPNAGYFQDEQTIALHFSTDGVRLFSNSKQEFWSFLVLNLNLPPEERYRV